MNILSALVLWTATSAALGLLMGMAANNIKRRRVIGEAEAVVKPGFSKAKWPIREIQSGDRLTVFERDGKTYVQFSDEREG